jgi:hypothetical protein
MKCIVKEMGFVNGSRVRPGQEFEATKCPKWAVEASKQVPEKKVLEKEPRTLSALSERDRAEEKAMLAKKGGGDLLEEDLKKGGGDLLEEDLAG